MKRTTVTNYKTCSTMFRMVCITFLLLVIKNVARGQIANFLNVPNVEDVRVYEDIVYETYRLPNNTRPALYDVHLRTWIHEGNFAFEGRVEIFIIALETYSNIVLHQRQLNISSFELRDLSNGDIVPVSMSYDPIREFLVFDVITDELEAGNRYLLQINYTGTLRSDKAGFYRSSYLNDDGERIWLATTHFEATDARHAMPCYDEPALKARFSISITHDPSYSAVSNMPVSRQENNSDGSITTIFDETVSTSTYLIAFIVSDFEFLSNENGGAVPHRTIARPNAIHLTEFALEIGVEMLDILSDFIGISYSLPKVDQAAIPDFAAGAMENWGLVTYREPALFYDINETTVFVEAGISGVIAHEFSHQWFGNLVSPRWWTYLWLNEGFATFYENFAVNLMYPAWHHMEYFVATTRYNVLRSDSLVSTHPMSHHIETPNAIDAMFNNIAYGKSALVLRMFANAYSMATFTKGVSYYLEISSFSDVSEEDLFLGIQIATFEDSVILPATVQTLMRSWTRQSGFPIVTVTRDYNVSTNVTFSQRRFMSEPTATPDSSLFWVPIFFGLPSDPSHELGNRSILWISNREESHQISELTNADWLIVNKLSSGFYRVLYDRQNYRLIANALNEDIERFEVTDRASLIDDLYNFAENDLVAYDVFFEYIQYMKTEHYYEAWYTATQALASIVRRFDGQTNNEVFRDFVRSLLEFYYEFTGIEDEDGEHRLKKYSRNLAITWACNMGSTACRTDTILALRSIIASNGEFHQNVRNVLYCAALRSGDRSDYESVWDRLLASNSQDYRNILINALGCTSTDALLQEFLNSSLNSTNSGDFEYRTGEHIRIFNAVYQSGIQGLNLAVPFLTSHLEEAAITFGRNNIANIITGIAERISLYSQSNEFGQLLYSALNDNFIEIGVVDRALSITTRNQLWFYKHQAVIATWLSQNHANSNAETIN